MENRVHYKGIDVFKFVMALAVVVLHTHPLQGINRTLNFLTADVIGRIAVPFFFVSTGFLLERQLQEGRCGRREVLSRYVCKVLKLYLVWTIVYMPVIIWDKLVESGDTWIKGVLTIVRDLIFVGSYAHLWYLLAVVTGVIFVSLLRIHLGEKGTAVILLLLFAMGLLTQSYFGLLVKTVNVDGGLWSVMKAVKKIMVTCRNGIFFGGIFLYMGTWIAGHPVRIGQWKAAAGLTVSILLLAVEAWCLRQRGYVREQDMYLMLLPAAFFLMILAIQTHVKVETYFYRKMSMNIYFVHMIFKFVYREFVNDSSGSNAGMFCFTLFGAFAAAYLMYQIEKSRNRKKMMQSGAGVIK